MSNRSFTRNKNRILYVLDRTFQCLMKIQKKFSQGQQLVCFQIIQSSILRYIAEKKNNDNFATTHFFVSFIVRQDASIDTTAPIEKEIDRTKHEKSKKKKRKSSSSSPSRRSKSSDKKDSKRRKSLECKECAKAARAEKTEAAVNKCKLTSAYLAIDQLRVLTAMGGLFYAGRLSAVQAPDVYAITLDGERGNRPHIHSREEILRDAVNFTFQFISLSRSSKRSSTFSHFQLIHRVVRRLSKSVQRRRKSYHLVQGCAPIGANSIVACTLVPRSNRRNRTPSSTRNSSAWSSMTATAAE